jgi:3-dehydroquinate synthase
MAMKTVNASINNKTYEINIGNNLSDLLISNPLFIKADKVCMIAAASIKKLHPEFINTLLGTSVKTELLIMKDSEKNKNYSYAEIFLNKILDMGLSRKSLVIGIGGGVVGDFAGFISSIYMRGINFINVPTTLLSMVDSSLGGKTAVNLRYGKNITGTFHQPKLVFSDLNFLKTLPADEFKNGLAEIFKHGLIGEKKTLSILKDRTAEEIVSSDYLEELIFLSASFKASIVAEDEREGGRRAILNFGHTTGHAIESVFGYRGISHGEAVAVGIKAAVVISEKLGMLSADEKNLIIDIMKKIGLGNRKIKIDPEKIISHMKYDKKNYSGIINFVLLKGIGNAVINYKVDDMILQNAIKMVI